MSFALAVVGRALHAAANLAPAPPAIEVCEDDAQAAVRSERLLRRGGAAVPGFAPLSRLWPAADGWVRTHANYPWHRDALLAALGVAEPTGRAGAAIADDGGTAAGSGGRAGGGDTPAAGVASLLASAVSRLPAREVERRVLASGGLAVALRDAGTWRAETGLNAPDLVVTAAFGDAPPRRPRRPPTRPAPLAGVRVLDLTRVIAGPTATRYMGALGADVLRLDDPRRPELELHRLDGLLGKRSAMLDLADGVRLRRLLRGADVVMLGARPGALERFGLAPEALAERYPGLIVVSLSAWGHAAGWRGRRGFDSLVQVATGLAATRTRPGGMPGALPCQLLDHATGYLMVAATCEMLDRQRRLGGTYHAELALAHTAHHVLAAGTIEDADPRTRRGRFGDLEVVQPPGALDGRPLTWPGPPARYGADAARW